MTLAEHCCDTNGARIVVKLMSPGPINLRSIHTYNVQVMTRKHSGRKPPRGKLLNPKLREKWNETGAREQASTQSKGKKQMFWHSTPPRTIHPGNSPSDFRSCSPALLPILFCDSFVCQNFCGRCFLVSKTTPSNTIAFHIFIPNRGMATQ